MNPARNDFLGHPKGLCVLFLTEMWERFSFYGMRGLLIFYLTQHFLYSRQQAYAIFAAYASLNFIGPVIGGLLADRYLGFRKAVTLGAILLMCGHFGLALEGPPAAHAFTAAGEPYEIRSPLHATFFYLSLGLLVLGVAFLKPCISTLVGRLYSPTDHRRDAGFTLFYLGINIGSASGILVCGYLGINYGWAAGFGIAGIGMLIGLIIFLSGQRWLGDIGEPPRPEELRTKIALGLTREHLIYAGALAAVLAVHWLLQHVTLAAVLVNGAAITAVACYLIYIFARCTAADRNRMLTLLVYIFATVAFFGLFEQAPSSLSILADDHVDLRFLGLTIAAAQVQSLNPLLVVLLGPAISIFWSFLGRRGREPSMSVKIALGLILVACGYFVLMLGIHVRPEHGKIELIWIVLLYLLLTLGELSLSPTGLSAVTKLAARDVVGFAMGVYLLSYAYAQFIAGIIASKTTVTAAGDELSGYLASYGWAAALALAAGIVMLCLSPLLNRLSRPA